MEREFVRPESSHDGRARTMPAEAFTSRHVFRRERERIFRDRWLFAGHVSDLVEPGDFLHTRPAGDSVLLTRGEEGEIHGLYNVCRHRGARLCEEDSGSFGRSIQCPYHGWTYRLDGRLVGAPQMSDVEDFDPGEHSLGRVAVDVWEGFLFLSLAPDPEPLEEWMGPLSGRFSRFGIPELRRAERLTYEVEANWKLLFQNYSECQHCPLIHPELSEKSPHTSGVNDLTEGPFLGGYMEIREDADSMTLSGGRVGAPVGDLPDEDLGRVYYYSIFPNLLLSLHPDYVMTHRLRPVAPDRTLVCCDFHFHPDTLASPEYEPADAVEFWDRTNRQDWDVCERSQRGIRSRGYRPGPYFPRESLLPAWDREYRRRMGEDAPG